MAFKVGQRVYHETKKAYATVVNTSSMNYVGIEFVFPIGNETTVFSDGTFAKKAHGWGAHPSLLKVAGTINEELE